MKPLTLLQLGGSLEAFMIADALSQFEHIRLITSFAGRTQRRRPIKGEVRVGHFGGVTGLMDYVRAEAVDAFIEATHPFAVNMKHNAFHAAEALGRPIIFWQRPLWLPHEGALWLEADDVEAGAALVPECQGQVLLAIGRQDIQAFARRKDLSFVIRVIDAPEAAFDHPATQFVNARGPFRLEDEYRFFDAYNIQAVVSKNSGGEAAMAKLTVARERGLPVVMIKRPESPKGHFAESLDEILAWVKALQSEEKVIGHG